MVPLDWNHLEMPRHRARRRRREQLRHQMASRRREQLRQATALAQAIIAGL